MYFAKMPTFSSNESFLNKDPKPYESKEIPNIGKVIPEKYIGLSMFQTKDGSIYQNTVHGFVRIHEPNI